MVVDLVNIYGRENNMFFPKKLVSQIVFTVLIWESVDANIVTMNIIGALLVLPSQKHIWLSKTPRKPFLPFCLLIEEIFSYGNPEVEGFNLYFVDAMIIFSTYIREFLNKENINIK